MKTLCAFAVAICLCCPAFETQAQNYKSSVGLRFGLTSGLSGKHFIGEAAALEGILSFRPAFGGRYSASSLTLLYELHKQLGDIENLYFFYGAGGHMAFGLYKHREFGVRQYMGVGVDGIIGAEYRIPEIPITVGLDFKPFLELPLSGHDDKFPYLFGGFAFTVRYIIK